MASVIEARPGDVQSSRKNMHWVIAVVAVVLFVAAFRFVDRAVLPYYVNYDSEHFGPYWPKRFGILGHITFGTLALLVGPFQLWSGLRRRYPVIHRWTGRLFVAACLLSAACAYYMALTPSFGWGYGLGLAGLATIWVGCTLIGYFSIRRATVVLHRRWMIRAYVITFAFVTYRMFTDYLAWRGIGDVVVRNQVAAWFCWSVPLALTLIAEGISDVRKAKRRSRA